MRKMEEEIFVANSKGDVKALGMKINCAPADLHIYVNGVDITKNVVLERARQECLMFQRAALFQRMHFRFLYPCASSSVWFATWKKVS
jgi:hypothetical protein